MVSDALPWLPEALKAALDHIGASGEVLCAMTMAERVRLVERYSLGDALGAMAETAVCDAPDDLKDNSKIATYRHTINELLTAPLPVGYTPLAVDITVTGIPEGAVGPDGLEGADRADDDADVDNADDASVPVVGTVLSENDDGDNAVINAKAPLLIGARPKPTRTDLETAYVGIANQGGTCYLNSTVQALFHIPKFRQIIYGIRVTEDAAADSASITTALQNLFMALQTRQSSVSTVELTRSFGWDVRDAHEQHDAHEMIQRLLEAFEMITEGTPVKDELKRLFYGKQLNYVRCLDVDYVSRNPAEFFDLELLTLNNEDMAASLQSKVTPEKLDGEYKREYDDGREPTKHEAEMGCVFLSLPPVLFVHPSRVNFCMQTFQRKMVETEWKFDTKFNFSRYVAKDPEAGVAVINDGEEGGEDDPALDYELLSVIMHSGTPFSGHYISYTRFGDRWLKFNDSSVSEVDEASVLADAYSTPTASTDYWGTSSRRPAYTRASVLVYIKASMRDELIFPITDAALPEALHANLKLKEEREARERIEAELRARRVSVRFLVGDAGGSYLSALGSVSGRDGPTEKAEMDKDVTGEALGQAIADAAGIAFDTIEDLWVYPDYFYASSAYYAPKRAAATATAGELAKGWVFVQLKGSAPVVPPAAASVAPAATDAQSDDDNAPPMEKELTEEPEKAEDPTATTADGESVAAPADGDTTDAAAPVTIPPEPAPPALKLKPAELAAAGPALIPLCVYRKGSLEYLGVCTSLAEARTVLAALEPSMVDEEQRSEMVGTKRERTRPLRTYRFDDDLYGDGDRTAAEAAAAEEGGVVLEFEDTFGFCTVEKNALKNVKFSAVFGGSILIAFASTHPTSLISNAFDKLCNPLAITVYQLDDAMTPEELCELIICPSYSYEQLQEAVFDAMAGKTAELLHPLRRVPHSKAQIGFRCHDDRTDRPSRTMALTSKGGYYRDAHTAQSILANKGQYVIAKLYVEVLPKVISVPELDGHGRVCDIPLHLGYFYRRHFYMKEGSDIPLYEVFRVAMAQQLSSLPAEFRDRVEHRWLASQRAYIANNEAVAKDPSLDMICKQSTFDPVFRLVRMQYNGKTVSTEHYDWSASVRLDMACEYVVDLLPADITKVGWTTYASVTPQVKPYVFVPSAPQVADGAAATEASVEPILADIAREELPKTPVDGENEAEKESDGAASNKTNAAEEGATSSNDVESADVPDATAAPIDGESVPAAPADDVSDEALTAEAPAIVEKQAEAAEEGDTASALPNAVAVDDATPPPLQAADDFTFPLPAPVAPVVTASEGMAAPATSEPEPCPLMWYQLFHGDRSHTDAIYGLVSSVILPRDASLTGEALLDMILQQIGVVPDEACATSGDAAASASPSAVTSPTTASPRGGDAYQTAKKTWKLVFKGSRGLPKVLEPKTAFSTIEKDIGDVQYIMLDHPQSTKARVLSRYQRSEQAIRIGIIASETEKMKQKHVEGKAKA